MEAVQGHAQHGPGRRINVTSYLKMGKQRKDWFTTRFGCIRTSERSTERICVHQDAGLEAGVRAAWR